MSTRSDRALFNDIDIGLTAIHDTLELLKNEILSSGDDPSPTASVLLLVLPELQRLMALAESGSCSKAEGGAA